MAQQELDELKIDSGDLEKLLQDSALLDGFNMDTFGGATVTPGGQQQTHIRVSGLVQNSTPRTQRMSAVNNNQPYAEIIEQPKCRGLRFRYECEGRSAGSIVGESSTVEKKTFPTLKIHNHDKPAVVVVSCVTKEDPARPHPHSLVGRDCQQGVCTVKLKTTRTAEFQGLGIQCAKKREVVDALKRREDIRVDPFGTGFSHKTTPGSIDLNVVRLCFQVFLPDKDGKFTRIITPVVSEAIYDKKAKSELTICRVDKHAGSVKGGEEVFILCEKVNSKDIEVRFYEENSVDGVVWEDYASFGQGDVHRQYAIVFKTPPYRDQTIKNPVNVFMQLRRPSDREMSDPKPFQYKPLDEDPEGIEGKRKRKRLCMTNFAQDLQTDPLTLRQDNGSAVSNSTRERLSEKIKAGKRSTKIKQENPCSPVNMDIGQLSQSAWSVAPVAMPVTSSVMWNSASFGFGPGNGGIQSTAPSTINRADFAELTSVTGPPSTYKPQMFTTSSAPSSNAQNLLETLSEGGSTNTMDATVLFEQQLNISSPVYLNETEAGLSGDLATVDYDPNIGAHENVVSMDEANVGFKSADLVQIEDIVLKHWNTDDNMTDDIN